MLDSINLTNALLRGDQAEIVQVSRHLIGMGVSKEQIAVVLRRAMSKSSAKAVLDQL